jgi:hypothetical protein
MIRKKGWRGKKERAGKRQVRKKGRGERKYKKYRKGEKGGNGRGEKCK